MIPLPHYALSRRRGQVWTPARLFEAGEIGLWLDPSDISTMFQDAGGTTPVTAVGQPVGRILDKSGRGNHATQADASRKPILQSIGGKLALVFDGVDDFLSTGNIDFTGTDKMTVVAGVRSLAAHFGFVMETSTNYNPNGFGIYTHFGPFVHIAHNGTGFMGSRTSSKPSPFSAVIASVYDKTGTTRATEAPHLRLNGVDDRAGGDEGPFANGTGNFGNYPIYIGSRAGTSFFFNGHIYQLVVRGALTAGLAPIESFTADKMGITL